MIDVLPYLLPLLPMGLRGRLAWRYRGLMWDRIPEEAHARESHRSLLVALAGFSFTGVLGLVALPGELPDRQLPIWYLVLSFASYLGALNLQGYKTLRWHDHVGDGLLEVGSLGLLLAVISFILASDLSVWFKVSSTVVAGLVWIVDVSIRVTAESSYLRAESEQRRSP